ncbi:MAG: hypothetical protein K6D59_06810, partial [Bacteroidales bacterium]|nr:hypothetical protein [Bacteroidales bacterium]
LLKLHAEAHVEVFSKMNHGQLLIDHPEEVAARIDEMAAKDLRAPREHELNHDRSNDAANLLETSTNQT